MIEQTSQRRWVPKNIEWFLAEMIQEFDFTNGDGPLVWVNTILIQASSVDEAYEKSMAKGKEYDYTFINSDQEEVTSRFRGLRDLYLIYEKLEHGAELLYSEYDEITEEEIVEMSTPKDELAAFKLHSPQENSAVSSSR
jgi:hypothetical protein